jgi:hypothetical protein
MLTFRNDGAWSKVGRLGLSDAEEDAIVSFMQKALSSKSASKIGSSTSLAAV